MSFKLRLLIHFSFLIATMFGLVFVIQRTELWATSVLLALTLAAQLWLLLNFLSSTQRELSQFMEAALQGDVTRHHGNSLLPKDISTRFTQLQAHMQQLSQEKEALQRYHEVMLEKIPVAVLVIVDNAGVELINGAARKLLQRNACASPELLGRYGEQFYRDLLTIAPGEHLISQMHINTLPTAVALSCAYFSSMGHSKKIISIQPIQRELDERELQAWQHLLQVFTHEIMNSMTPVASLSDTARQLLTDAGSPDSLADARAAISTVARRANHLMDFVQAYRRVAQPPVVIKETVDLQDFFDNLQRLFNTQTNQQQVRLSFSVRPINLQGHFDPAQLEQVFINLIKNALESLAGQQDGEIAINAYIHHSGRLAIDVMDNGAGIAADKLEQIFVPFFTTKNSGTGVGLFLVKQIMQAHQASVSVLQPAADAHSSGAVFQLLF